MSTGATSARARWLGHRHVISVGPIGISGYVAMLYVGIVVGMYAGSAVATSSGLSTTRWLLTSIGLLVPALVGARLWYVAQHLETYRREPHRVWQRSEGGSALYGGLLLSVLVSVPVLHAVGLPFLPFWDAAIVTMLVGLAFARVGCLMHGCCAGRETRGALGMWLPDSSGAWLRRYPTQLLEGGWALVALVIALVVRDGLPAGGLFAVVVGLYAAGRLVLEPTRQTDDPHRTTLVNVAFSGVLLALALAAVALAYR